MPRVVYYGARCILPALFRIRVRIWFFLLSVTIKYIQKADDDRFVRLVSHNPHHSPKDIPADSIQALALVKASVRFNTMG